MKSIVLKLLAVFGLELRRITSGRARNTDHMALQIALQNGLQVNTVIDVGAAFGHWTQGCLSLFPQARYVLVEPLAQYDEYLASLLNEFPQVIRVKAGAADRIGQATFFVHDDLVGSSLRHETEGNTVDGQPIQIETTTLDAIVEQQKLLGPFLLKIDVQGVELEVLEGAAQILPQTEYLLVETSLFEFFRGGPLIHEVIAYLQHRGFVIYDILNLQYRLLDNSLGQVDLIFVPVNSRLRREHIYALPHQREEQNKQFKQALVINKKESL